VCTESQPAAFVKVFAYEPDVVYVEPDHANVLQADSVVEPVLLYLIVRFIVCTESQLATFWKVFVYAPDVVYVVPVHVNVLQADSIVEAELLYLIVRFNV
jgi:hypothetical protein